MRFLFVVHKNEEKAEQNSVLFHRLTLKERGLRPNGYFPLMRQPLVLQNDIGNLYSPTTIVAAVTAKQTKKKLPVHTPISACMLRTDSTLLLEQIRTIDKCRLQAYLGSINQKEMRDIDRALKLSIGLMPPPAARKKYSRKYI